MLRLMFSNMNHHSRALQTSRPRGTSSDIPSLPEKYVGGHLCMWVCYIGVSVCAFCYTGRPHFLLKDNEVMDSGGDLSLLQ